MRLLLRLLAGLGLLLALAACTSGSPTAPPVLPTSVSVTQVSGPTAAPTLTAIRIAFPAEPPLEARIEGDLPAGALQQYRFPARGGETLTLSLSTEPPQGAVLSLWGADGTVLLSNHAGAQHWSGEVPSTQDYIVAVLSRDQDVHYLLTIQRVASTPAPSPPARLQLDAHGQGQVEGTLQPGEIRPFAVSAQAGQELEVHLSTQPPGSAILAIWGADGTVLLSDHATATQWRGKIPQTQDYMLAVIGGPNAATFTLTVQARGPEPQATPESPSTPPKATATPTPTATPTASAAQHPQAQRLVFEPGGRTAQTLGVLEAGQQARYVISGRRGATMTVTLSLDPAEGATLAIWGADGTVLLSDHAGATHWRGVLPADQDYYIQVMAAPEKVYYALRVDMTDAAGAAPTPTPTPIRIAFPPGGTVMQVEGEVPPQDAVYYVLRAAKDQEMRVRLEVPTQEDGTPAARLSIWGADGTVLLSGHTVATAWTGTLPATQDYFILIQTNRNTAVPYRLEVEIPAP